MKRLTLILLAVFAITACRNNQGTTDSGECNPTPSKVECKAEGTQFTYDEATGLFTTVAGEITVPAATYTTNPETGAVVVAPGVSTLTVTGTI